VSAAAPPWVVTALKVLGALPTSKETKSLTDKIQARLKKANIT
jgi:hypothetical protein